jgi:hypothetical protein
VLRDKDVFKLALHECSRSIVAPRAGNGQGQFDREESKPDIRPTWQQLPPWVFVAPVLRAERAEHDASPPLRDRSGALFARQAVCAASRLRPSLFQINNIRPQLR